MGEDQRHDPRRTIERDRIGAKPMVALAVLAILISWEVRNTWVDALAPPYPTERDESELAKPAPAPAGESSDEPDVVLIGPTPARGQLQGLFQADDYPAEAIRRDEQGTVIAALQINEAGRVSGCTIATSSGSPSLDRRTCDVLSSRARFRLAADANGRPQATTYNQRITWRLEG